LPFGTGSNPQEFEMDRFWNPVEASKNIVWDQRPAKLPGGGAKNSAWLDEISRCMVRSLAEEFQAQLN